MADNLIFSDKEAAFLEELVRQNVRFMIVGLSAAALQGAPVVTQDVDLWFADLSDPGIKKALKKVGGIYVPPTANTPPLLGGEAVKLFDIVVHMHGLGTFQEEEKHTLSILLGTTRVKVLSLESIIKSKKALRRQKDKLVLPVLSDALITIKETGGLQKKRDQ